MCLARLQVQVKRRMSTSHPGPGQPISWNINTGIERGEGRGERGEGRGERGEGRGERGEGRGERGEVAQRGKRR